MHSGPDTDHYQKYILSGLKIKGDGHFWISTALYSCRYGRWHRLLARSARGRATTARSLRGRTGAITGAGWPSRLLSTICRWARLYAPAARIYATTAGLSDAAAARDESSGGWRTGCGSGWSYGLRAGAGDG